MTALFTPLLDAFALASSAEERPRKRAKVDEPMYAHVIMHSTTSESDSPEAIRLAVLKAMFEAAAAERAVESNRRKIYKVWREEGDDE
jgi:ribosomal RNA-processing protein 1